VRIAPHIQERLARAGLEWVRIRVREYMRRLTLEVEGLTPGKGDEWVQAPKEEAIGWLKSGGMNNDEAHQVFHELYIDQAGFMVSLHE
jgi:hypothetical protein